MIARKRSRMIGLVTPVLVVMGLPPTFPPFMDPLQGS
jgi:hypothetical protein